MDRNTKVIEGKSLLQQKDQYIMKLQADLSLQTNQIMNLQFGLKLKDDLLKQMHLALVESQTKMSFFMTKLQLTTRELHSASSNRKKLSQQYFKAKATSGLEIEYLKSLLNNKDSQFDSLSSVKKRLVKNPVEVHIEKTKTEVKPFPTPQNKIEVNRKEVIEKFLSKKEDKYEILLVQMEEGTLCDPSKSTDNYQTMKEQQKSTILEESPKKKVSEESAQSNPSDSLNTISNESPKILLTESPKELPEDSLKPVILKESSKPVILDESPKHTILLTKEITVPKKHSQQQQQVKAQKMTNSLTMEEFGLFDSENKQGQNSYEQSLTMQQLGLFNGENDEAVSEENDKSKEHVEPKENADDDNAIYLLLRMEEGLLYSQF